MIDREQNDKSHQNSVIQMLRTMQQHHVQLSAMADQKASFLIASTFVVLSILTGFASRGHTSWTMIFMGSFLLLAACFSIMAVTPHHKSRSESTTSTNLLFFGHFAQLELDDFMLKMEKVITNDDSVYKTMLHDIHSIGVVLYNKKYKYLSISYRLFLYGLLCTPVVAVIEWYFL